jgi:glucokinase
MLRGVAAQALAIGVDVGGTKVAAGVVDERGRILRRHHEPCPTGSSAEAVAAVCAAIERLREEFDTVSYVGIGAAGFVDAERSTVLFAPHLPWRDEPLRADVSARVGLPVVLDNDANAMAWGEHRFGAGRDVDGAVYLTVGTGIGGGLVIADRVYRGGYGMAGEVGHLPVDPGGRECGCGQRGCLEQYASGGALVLAARELAGRSPGDAALLLAACGGDLDRLEGTEVTAAAPAGDPAARAAFDEIGRWLGVGLAALAAVLDPVRFVVGGGVVDAGELLLAPARSSFERSLTAAGHRPFAGVVAAELGPDAGLVGAADLARSDLRR